MQNNNEVLRILHTVYNNTLQPLQDTLNIPAITTHLYPHQNTLIHGMHEYRHRMTQGLKIDNDEIKAKIGIIADPSGSGKTLSILGYLASDTHTCPSFELTQYSSPYFYSQKKRHEQISTNLIIVPSNLLGHWEDEIKKFGPYQLKSGAHNNIEALKQKGIMPLNSFSKNFKSV